MELNSKYENIISHFIPGILSTLGIILFIEGISEVELLEFIESYDNRALLVFSITAISLFIGLFQDSIRHRLPKSKSLIRINTDNNFDRDHDFLDEMVQDRITPEKYSIIINEYYYYYEFIANTKYAFLIFFVSLPFFLAKHQIACLKIIISEILILGLLLLATKIEHHYYRRFVSAFAKKASKKKVRSWLVTIIP